MAKAFKCDVCNEHYDGYPHKIEFYRNDVVCVIKKMDVCKTCFETLMNMRLPKPTGGEKRVDEE